MPLPVTITGAFTPPGTFDGGPFLSSAGNVYVVSSATTLFANDTVKIWKATDPTSSFSQVLLTWAWTTTTATVNAGICAVQSGDTLHVVARGNGELAYRSFNMADDTWGTATTVATGLSTLGQGQVSIAARSNGDLVVLYKGATAAVMGTSYDRVVYARRISGTWTAGVAVDAAGAFHYYAMGAVIGASDRVHLFFAKEIDPVALIAEVQHRSLSSANALDTVVSITSTAVSGTSQQGRGTSYVDGATTKVRWPYLDNTATTLHVARLDSAATPAITTENAGTPQVSSSTTGGWSLRANGTSERLLYANGQNSDIYRVERGVTFWPTASLLVVGTFTYVGGQVYNRSGTKHAYLYQVGSDLVYNEVTVAAHIQRRRFPAALLAR